MTRPYKILATPYFKLSIQRLSHFLGKKYSPQHATDNKRVLQKKIKATLPENPHIAPISSRLIELGISEYRQWAIDDHNMIFYRISDEEGSVYLLLAMDSRQDIQKLLYELMLLK